jgi:NAD(P)-dependent dehydrogenase (short-subunit alcohol dehydrogenase family)
VVGSHTKVMLMLGSGAKIRVVSPVLGSRGLCRRGGPVPSVDHVTAKVALVTGANKGIGFETARQLGALGMTVLVGARDRGRGQAAAQALGARFVQLDVTDSESALRVAEWIDQEYGRLDVLVNNAGITGSFGGPPSETSLAAMRMVYETNVFGVIAVTNALMPLLRRAPAARIVNVSSEVGSIASRTDPDGPMAVMPPSLPYTSSKTALNMVTAMYAMELKDTPIKVNAANPGYTATDLNGHNGFRTPAEGAEVSVHLATLDSDGPTGTLWGHIWTTNGPGGYGVLPW